MSLLTIKRSYQTAAAPLGDYQSMSKTELANGYSDAKAAGDERKMNQYFSALVLRYWYKIPQWMRNSASLHRPPEEFVDWLVDSLLIAFRYEAWRNPDDPLYGDPNGPDKVINRCCFSTRGREYQYYNKDKRKNSTQAVSLDVTTNDSDTVSLLDTVTSTKGPEPDGAYELIELFLSQNNPVGAMIIDGIAYQDSFKAIKNATYVDEKDSQGRDIKKKYISTSSQFDMRKLVRHLKTIDQKFIDEYFSKRYDLGNIPKDSLASLFENMNYAKIHRSIEKTFKEIRGNKNLLDYLLS